MIEAKHVIQYECDRCGKDLEHFIGASEIRIHNVVSVDWISGIKKYHKEPELDYDLCFACTNELYDIIVKDINQYGKEGF